MRAGLAAWIRRHRRALVTILAALALVGVLGVLYARAERIPVWHGLFCMYADAVTVGGDVSPSNHYAYLIFTLDITLALPLFAATVSLVTSVATSLTVSRHMAGSEDRIKSFVHQRLNEHHTAIKEQLAAAGYQEHEREPPAQAEGPQSHPS